MYSYLYDYTWLSFHVVQTEMSTVSKYIVRLSTQRPHNVVTTSLQRRDVAAML